MSSGYERYINNVILVVIIIVIKVEWLWKPARLLCYVFLLAFLDLTVHNVQ